MKQLDITPLNSGNQVKTCMAAPQHRDTTSEQVVHTIWLVSTQQRVNLAGHNRFWGQARPQSSHCRNSRRPFSFFLPPLFSFFLSFFLSLFLSFFPSFFLSFFLVCFKQRVACLKSMGEKLAHSQRLVRLRA